MSDVTSILSAIRQGDVRAADDLLPLVYEELRKLAAAKLDRERPGQTLQPTALVHEAYLRLVRAGESQQWDSCGHFFAAAAEAMRRILVENARRKGSIKRGGEFQRIPFDEQQFVSGCGAVDLLALDEALENLASHDARKAELVKLRFFAGLTIRQAAKALAISESTADADWAYAKAWLRMKMGE